MAFPKFPGLKLSPRVRRVAGAAVLVAGVFLVTQELKTRVPRDVEVHVGLGAFVRAGEAPRAVEVTLSRGAEVVRSLERRYPATERPPGDLVTTLSLPEGRFWAHVAVTLDNRVLARDGAVTVHAGTLLELPAPSPE